MKKGKIHIGCSGWNYDDWRGRFYPKDTPKKRWFEFYAETFDTVEINNTFYQLPGAQTFKAWRSQAPDGFVYAVKASRYLTHLKRLKDAKAPLKKFLSRTRLLRERLGPILYQLPPRWRLNMQRLESFLDLLPEDIMHVFEFRDQSWMTDEVFQILEERGVSFCAHDMPGLDVPRLAIGPIAYVRFHGATAKYRGGYPGPTLRSWGRWMEQQLRSGKNLYVYFNNDTEAHAPHDALKLIQKLN
ncbi:MAG: DUF72 domain-containing protein [Chloracidobacterium sp.]|nr:DUF72 domain-containing protein [Chloracidobacterium sp.]